MFSLATTQSCIPSRMALGLKRSRSPTSIQMRIGSVGLFGDEVFVKFPRAVRRTGHLAAIAGSHKCRLEYVRTR